jgi:hypothetical protein
MTNVFHRTEAGFKAQMPYTEPGGRITTVSLHGGASTTASTGAGGRTQGEGIDLDGDICGEA